MMCAWGVVLVALLSMAHACMHTEHERELYCSGAHQRSSLRREPHARCEDAHAGEDVVRDTCGSRPPGRLGTEFHDDTTAG